MVVVCDAVFPVSGFYSLNLNLGFCPSHFLIQRESERKREEEKGTYQLCPTYPPMPASARDTSHSPS